MGVTGQLLDQTPVPGSGLGYHLHFGLAIDGKSKIGEWGKSGQLVPGVAGYK